ncbi:MAG TPA: threonine--tRNA ligase [Chloroflexota bacterium]|nr:threonine--tRNA ligase [Chloroflexota bacterium]
MSHNGSSVSHAELDVMRHSAAHVLAKAVQRLYPGSKLGIGPVIDNGFYYDIDIPSPVKEEDLPRIEQAMRDIIAAGEGFAREEWSKQQALDHYSTDEDNPYKREIVQGLADDEAISFYRTGGDWVDLCRGPHVHSADAIGAFKLTSVSGAYWRGDEKRPMLQRIYGTAWATQEQLDHYLWQIEEARRRDHRKLGRELELFFFDEVAPGQPFWLPKGLRVIHELETLLQRELDSRGYLEISTPSLVKSDLWKQSGHWDFYEQGMFKLEVEEEDYAFKPMNCPESTLVYSFKTRSYRDLPLRLAQTDRLLRNERSGTLNGLLRVRQLTMDDAHIFCRPDQVQAEIRGVLEFQKAIYDVFGLEPTYYLSTRPEKAIGDPAVWERAEADLRAALEDNGLTYQVKAGEGAFYGPKIDVDIQDALGRPWQLNTTQLDFQQPDRFKLEYIGEDGQAHQPVMIHRAIFGTYERFMAVLIEHYAGAFPLWLAPVQAVIVPIADRHVEYADTVAAALRAAGFRVEVDARREKMQAKIRDAQAQQVPYMLVVGDRDQQGGTVSVRERRQGDLGAQPLAEFIAMLQERRAAYT